MDLSALQIAVFFFVGGSLGAVALGLSQPSDAAQLRDRIDRIAGRAEADPGEVAGQEDQRRRRRVKETLREIRAREIGRARRRAKPTLTGRLRQAGLDWTRKRYASVSVAAGILCFAGFLSLAGLGLLPAIGFGIAGGLFLPHLYVANARAKRLAKFSEDFPNAIDIIVRGVRSGLPLVDGLKIIAAECEDPIREEFAMILRDQSIGVPLDEAVQRLADRMPLSETAFFAIVIGIQSRTGGNLSEALSNLSKVVRGRKQIAAKIKAMSAEAKASALIIGMMPPAVMGILWVVSPDYIGLLFSTLLGNAVLAGSGLWMLFGTLVMRNMTRFDY
jgi:tight adherence protein B